MSAETGWITLQEVPAGTVLQETTGVTELLEVRTLVELLAPQIPAVELQEVLGILEIQEVDSGLSHGGGGSSNEVFKVLFSNGGVVLLRGDGTIATGRF